MTREYRLVDNAFIFEFGMLAEIDEQPEAEAGGLEVVVNLSAVLVDSFL